ncbi:FtsX-like permease family protein [Propionicimonas paludicola]|uniref:FtsX-like permease family protein n=1 Tax=Propionicimonas paludicola TaxID=185243 RepID=A0A2A9CPR3_9ACTN|nr:FtsX-like permease family protein [Propionicimonas paludicola]PFG15529.1 FtsX-like permease family protein [Propionicimonas paludicola]
MPEPAPTGAAAGPGRLRLRRRGLRRAGAQRGLIAALLVVFTVCSAASGACLLLLTAGDHRALSAAVSQADGTEAQAGPDLASMAVLADSLSDTKPDAKTLLPLVRTSLNTVAAPYPAKISLWTTSASFFLDGPKVRRGYLVEADTIAANATLTSGSWPTPAGPGAPIPAAVPQTAAEELGLKPGSTIRLLSDRSGKQASVYDLVVSGTFTSAETPVWTRDELDGRGYDPSHFRLPTFGPFIVAPGTMESRATPVEQLNAVLDPTFGGDEAGIPAYLQRLNAAPDLLKDQAGPAVAQVVVRSDLGAEFERWRSTLRVTDALVVTVFVLVLALGAATTALISRVLAGRRAVENTLLRDRGASSRQLVRSAAIEAVLVAVVAAVLAAPLALLGYWLSAPGSGSWWPWVGLSPDLAILAAALLAGALLPAAVVVLSALPPRSRRSRTSGAGVFVRSGADLMLAGLAVVAYLQLRSHAPTPGLIDPFLAVAPAACALAVAALIARLLPLLARAAEALARRGRGLVLPLAGWHLSRGGGTQGVFLLVLATAVGTLGPTFLATWAVSQDEQASVLVGTDLVVERPGRPDTGGSVATFTGSPASPIADGPIVLGSRPDGVQLLAVDAAAAGRLLVSRPPADASWAQVMAGLTPKAPANSLAVGSGPSGLTVTGTPRPGPSDAGLKPPAIAVRPTLVLSDGVGSTITQVGSEVTLDGRPHTVALPLRGQPPLPPGNWQLVAIELLLLDHSGGQLEWSNETAEVDLTITVAGASGAGGPWSAPPPDAQASVTAEQVQAAGDTIRASFRYAVLNLAWQEAHLTLLSFPASTDVPVAIEEKLAAELGLHVGDRIALAWQATALEAVVVRTVPYVPSHPRQAALLTDLTSLQHALLSTGRTTSLTTAWWVAAPRPGAAQAIRQAGQGPVLDRVETAAELRDGSLRLPVQYAWLLAIVVSVGLAIGGATALAAAQAQQRWITIARVRAIGASRREALASHFAQHAVVTVLAVGLGVVGGGLLSWALVPLLVVSTSGEPAVPPAIVNWAFGPSAAVIGVILVGGLLAGVPSALAMVRRSTVTALRMGEAR